MAHYGLLGTRTLSESADDIRGATLYGAGDEKLGKIDDVIFNHSTGDIHYLVVDTGGWLHMKKFIVPADRVRASVKHEDDYTSILTKKQVESFPPYDESDLKSEDRWKDYEDRYRSKWETGPVMHRAETDRNITPTTQQMQGNQSSLRAEQGLPDATTAGREIGGEPVAGGSVEAEGMPSRIVPAGVDSVTISNSASGIGGRWDTFQARLRERRKEAVTGCSTCTVGSAASRGSESADTFKKAV
jgi:hypothetical protein